MRKIKLNPTYLCCSDPHDKGALVSSHRNTVDWLAETVDDESCPTVPAMRKTVERLIAEILCRDRCARLSLTYLKSPRPPLCLHVWNIRLKVDGYPTDHVTCGLRSLLQTAKVEKPRSVTLATYIIWKETNPWHWVAAGVPWRSRVLGTHSWIHAQAGRRRIGKKVCKVNLILRVYLKSWCRNGKVSIGSLDLLCLLHAQTSWKISNKHMKPVLQLHSHEKQG